MDIGIDWEESVLSRIVGLDSQAVKQRFMISTQGNKIAKHGRWTLERFIFSCTFTQVEKLVQAVKKIVKSDIAHRPVFLTPF